MFPQDEVFVLLNIFCLGLFTASCMTLYLRLFPNSGTLEIIATTVLISFSYPLFCLIYGYFNFLLSGAFFFSALTLTVTYGEARNKLRYIAPAFAIIGVALTHSYLLPAIMLSFGLVRFVFSYKEKRTPASEAANLVPIIFAIILISSLSNGLLHQGATNSLKSNLLMAGYVNESLYLNVLPFLPFALIFMWKHLEDMSVRVLFASFVGAVCFSILMIQLLQMGKVALYYVNRNQLILISLLILANMRFVATTSLLRQPLRNFAFLGSAALVIIPYFFSNSIFRPTESIHFRRLLHDDYFVFHENLLLKRLSPLQMSTKDRELMRAIGRGESPCLDNSLTRVAVLGTDHEVGWFFVFTKIYPSLFDRQDYFINFENYEKNFYLWKKDGSQSYIIILNHFDYWMRDDILKQIRESATLVCEGDTIKIYKKI